MAGIQVGEVSEIELSGERARVTIRVKNDIPIRADACLTKRFPSALLPDALLDAVPGLCVTCDTGNWPFESRLADIKAIAGKVNFIHAKTHVFDAKGNEKNIDFPAINDIMKGAGFDGWWSIEWEGPGMSDEEGVRCFKDWQARRNQHETTPLPSHPSLAPKYKRGTF